MSNSEDFKRQRHERELAELQATIDKLEGELKEERERSHALRQTLVQVHRIVPLEEGSLSDLAGQALFDDSERIIKSYHDAEPAEGPNEGAKRMLKLFDVETREEAFNAIRAARSAGQITQENAMSAIYDLTVPLVDPICPDCRGSGNTNYLQGPPHSERPTSWPLRCKCGAGS